MKGFQKALPVWGRELQNEYNQFLGFYTKFIADEKQEIRIILAARTYYRLYVNGMIKGNGPARSAKGYCRMDEYFLEVSGETHIAVETAALDKPEKYCNDSTMESGMFIAEITDRENRVIAATGQKSESEFRYTELFSRKSKTETMSHSRGILEWYELNPGSFQWIYGEKNFIWKTAAVLRENVIFLPRRAPYATFRKIPMPYFTGINDLKLELETKPGFVLNLARAFNPQWYGKLREEEQFLEKLRGLKDVPFTGKVKMLEKRGLEVTPGKRPFAAIFEREKSELGFLDFELTISAETTVDVINTDHLSVYGELKANSYVTRYQLKPGSYHLTTFEPKLVRYVKMIFQTEGKVRVSYPDILDYSYPDEHTNYFRCSDGELNEIYEGAKRTLRLSTLDIFMDCPQRERGGWLCDSHFAARAAWILFGSVNTEKDFIENFMKTSNMWKGFFPEVYPGCKKEEQDPGFVNWSYWLMTELCDYYERSGDGEFVNACKDRVEEFVEGMLSLRGESGLIETERGQFVDWSLANRDFAVRPISIPNNCLAVCVLEKLGELYHRHDWEAAAKTMRQLIEELDTDAGIFGGGGDGAVFKNGKLSRTDCPTEGGKALELWSGFHREDVDYIKSFVRTMGPCPEYRANPNIGRANLFIGLMIRFDVLGKMGYASELVRELKSVYLEELKLGSGTFFENINAFSGCHGFNGMAGALIVEKVLGLGQPMQSDRTIHLTPHPGDLRWAEGTAACSDGLIFFKWSADMDRRSLKMSLMLPENWEAKFHRAPELLGWQIELNGKEL